MANPVFDYTTAKIIREMREQAHLFNAWMAPDVSKEAMILNECAARLEALNKPEYDDDVTAEQVAKIQARAQPTLDREEWTVVSGPAWPSTFDRLMK